MALRIRVKTPPESINNSKPEQAGDSQNDESEPVSPAGRMFLQPQTSCTILCIVGLENPVDVPSIKRGILGGIALHKRFSSIVKHEHGREHWVAHQLNIDDHIIVVPIESLSQSKSGVVEDYAASLATGPPLDSSRPLWEVHILDIKTENSAGSFILRIHHSLGDGTSLMSLVLASTRKVSNPQELPSVSTPAPRKPGRRPGNFLVALWKRLRSFFIVLWYTITEVGSFAAISFLRRDNRTPIKGSEGVERMRKQIASVEVSLEDMKAVKQATSATINDVMLAIVAAGITRYLRVKLPKASFKRLKLHATGLVNIRPTPGVQELAEMLKTSSKARWGNQMGYLIIPVPIQEHSDPLEYIKTAKKISKRKKASLEAPLTYAGGSLLMKLAGPKVASSFIYRTLVQTTMSISNVAGPVEQVMLDGNPITSITPTVVGQPQALCIHMQSYAGKAMLVATVARDIIPDPESLLQHCVASLNEMKQATTKASKPEMNN